MSAFEELLSRDQVAAYLGLTPRGLTWWIWALRARRRYHEFEIARRSGGEPRLIQTPIRPIRDMQEKILPGLVEAYEPWPHVHGFVSGRSAVTNADVHRGQRWILRLDLRDFFPSINFGRVRGMLMAKPFHCPPEVATTLAQICCHEGALPQGAPTSPAISNLICRGLDARLAGFANSAHCSYSRYADDLCFSTGRRTFPRVLAEIVSGRPVLNPDLRAIIVAEGFEINEGKTRLMPRHQRQRVTGLVVNKRLNVPREYRRHLRALVHIWRRYGEADAEAAFRRAFPRQNWPPAKPEPEFRLAIRGQIEYLGFVRGYDFIYQQVAQGLAELDPTFRPRLPKIPQSGRVIFAGEGPSDKDHLLAAARALAGEFSGLDLIEVSHKPPRSDADLWLWLQSRKDSRNLQPVVGIFDADSEYEAKLGSEGWLHLGNGVIAMAIVRPDWVANGERCCIELLHRPETLARTDEEGRRVFTRAEFDNDGLSFDGLSRMKHPKKSTLIVEDVERISDGVSIGLGKVRFAERVAAQVSPYETVSFDGFRLTLARLWTAVAMAQTVCS